MSKKQSGNQVKNSNKTLRLILGDQLNEKHSWFQNVDDSIVYVLMEVATETDYVVHHIQKVIGFFAAMREFSKQLQSKGHNVNYIRLTDADNLQTFEANLSKLLPSRNSVNSLRPLQNFMNSKMPFFRIDFFNF